MDEEAVLNARGGLHGEVQSVAPHHRESVCAIVVTRNRKELLARCLAALAAQTRRPDEVLVVDNASADGTPDLVRARFPDVELMMLDENVGGAGGFCRGIERAHAHGHDWLWVMDDDTLAFPDTLEELLRGAERAPVPPMLVASQVLWKDETLHPMNRQWIWWRRVGALALGVERGLVLLRAATFVSVAIRREAVDRFGLPLAQYFIWTDDIEYTARILSNEAGYLVPESRVYHWTDQPHTPLTASGDRFYYHVRNSLLLLRGSSLQSNERLAYLLFWLSTIGGFLTRSRPRRVGLVIVLRGIRDGLRLSVR